MRMLSNTATETENICVVSQVADNDFTESVIKVAKTRQRPRRQRNSCRYL